MDAIKETAAEEVRCAALPLALPKVALTHTGASPRTQYSPGLIDTEPVPNCKATCCTLSRSFVVEFRGRTVTDLSLTGMVRPSARDSSARAPTARCSDATESGSDRVDAKSSCNDARAFIDDIATRPMRASKSTVRKNRPLHLFQRMQAIIGMAGCECEMMTLTPCRVLLGMRPDDSSRLNNPRSQNRAPTLSSKAEGYLMSITPAQSTFPVQIPPPKLLTTTEELSMAKRALDQQPASAALRERYASLLLRKDHFDEVVALLGPSTPDTLSQLMLLIVAHVSRETPEDDDRAAHLLDRVLQTAVDSRLRATALTLRGKLLSRAGDDNGATEMHRESLRLNPSHPDPFKRIVAILLKEDRADEVVALAEQMLKEGVRHPRVLAARSLAFASLGHMDQAHQADGADRFLRTYKPAPPEGWDSLESFTDALAAELNAHPDIQYEKYGAASAQTWRIDEPALRRCAVFPALQKLVAREVAAYVQGLGEADHPFVLATPEPASLRMWSVLTEDDGHETWHVHQNGWLSGTFYVAIPDHIVQGTGDAGCIAFGLPEDVIGEAASHRFGRRIVRPEAGLMTIFPSHTFHRTFSHGGSGRRICCAFDVVPKSA